MSQPLPTSVLHLEMDQAIFRHASMKDSHLTPSESKLADVTSQCKSILTLQKDQWGFSRPELIRNGASI